MDPAHQLKRLGGRFCGVFQPIEALQGRRYEQQVVAGERVEEELAVPGRGSAGKTIKGPAAQVAAPGELSEKILDRVSVRFVGLGIEIIEDLADGGGVFRKGLFQQDGGGPGARFLCAPGDHAEMLGVAKAGIGRDGGSKLPVAAQQALPDRPRVGVPLVVPADSL